MSPINRVTYRNRRWQPNILLRRVHRRRARPLHALDRPARPQRRHRRHRPAARDLPGARSQAGYPSLSRRENMPQRPKIVALIWEAHLACYVIPSVHSPHVDRPASEGVWSNRHSCIPTSWMDGMPRQPEPPRAGPDASSHSPWTASQLTGAAAGFSFRRRWISSTLGSLTSQARLIRLRPRIINPLRSNWRHPMP